MKNESRPEFIDNTLFLIAIFAPISLLLASALARATLAG